MCNKLARERPSTIDLAEPECPNLLDAFKGLPTNLTEPQYDQEYQGTLCRLPFRTPALAVAGEISQVVIAQSEVEHMSR